MRTAAHAPCGGRRRAPAAVVVAVALAVAAPALASPLEAVPACTFDDVVVAHEAGDAEVTLLLDTAHRLGGEAVPPDLVGVREAGFASDHLVRRVVVEDLRALRDAAAAAGHELVVHSAYRSFDYQRRVHDGWVRALGEARARLVSARPGHSEHQLGTAIDLGGGGAPAPWDVEDWAATPEGAWTVANAHEFGFVLSYPAGATARSCYDYEPWHYRWVGRELARRVHDSGLSLREWLYRERPAGAAP